ncbi:MAG: hypothetical protein ACQESA_03390 [Patescibacteria group bacterium]
MGQEFNKEKTVLEEVVNVLPHKIKTYISSGKLENDIKTISQKYNLSKDQENELKKECTYVLMGAESPTGMSLNLEKSLSEKENRGEILTATTSILEPFIEDLAKINIKHYEKSEKDYLKKVAPAPPPVPPEGLRKEEGNDKERTPAPPPPFSKTEEGNKNKEEADKSENTPKPLTYKKEDAEKDGQKENNLPGPQKEKTTPPPPPKRKDALTRYNEQKPQTGEAKENLIRTIENIDRQGNDKETVKGEDR